MKVELISFVSPQLPVSLELIPETEVERQLLAALWKHGTIKQQIGGLGSRFYINWKSNQADPNEQQSKT